MEELALFIVIGLMVVLVLVPLLAIVALTRSSRIGRELQELKRQLDAVEHRVGALGRRVISGGVVDRQGEAASPRDRPVVTAADPATTASDKGPESEGRMPAAPAPPTPPRQAAEAAAPITPPLQTPASAPTPVAERPGAESAQHVVRASVAARTGTRVPPRDPPAPPPPSSPPTKPEFDWESLVGLRGAAWLGGITLVIAAVLLVKMAYDAGVFTPELRIATLIASGVACLAGAEFRLRRGFQTTANAVSGAGIAILYIALFAAYGLYHLLPMPLTFALMTLVTIAAGLLAIRYDAYFTAVLGLLGGFATPIALSTGQDRPIGLFSYILLLNVGLMSVALKRKWHGLVQLAFAGTLLIELGWFRRFMAPEKMLVGAAAFLLFGLLFLLLPLLARSQADAPKLLQVGAVGGIAPFLFAVLVAGNQSYSAEWPLLFGFVALLDTALIAVALLRDRMPLLVGASLATALTLPLWAVQGLDRGTMWGATLAAIGLTFLLNTPSHLAARLVPARREEHPGVLEAGSLVAASGFGLYTLVLVARELGEPPWLFLLAIAALTGLLVARSGARRVRGIGVAGALAIGLLILCWFLAHTSGDTLLRNLAVPLLFAIVLSVVASLRGAGSRPAAEHEAAAVAATAMAGLVLWGCLTGAELGREPAALFAALAVAMILALVSAVRSDWTPLLPISLVVSALFLTVWQGAFFHRSDTPLVLPAYAAFYLAFLSLPFAMPAEVRRRWRFRSAPWVTSALAGPAFFLVLHQAFVSLWGKTWIGALPLVLAGCSVAALRGVAKAFARKLSDTSAAQRRLRYLALFSAISLGFVALAIPLQLDRQWITIGWALEASAVWWLFGGLPHPGLKYFGLLLFAAVGVRLLLNGDVLHYQPRGMPVFNWLLYTYAVPAACCLLGSRFLKGAESRRDGAPGFDFVAGDRQHLAPGVAFLGLLLIFWLINLEVTDFYSPGRYVEFSMERQLARDLTMSVAWAIYALTLLVLGLARSLKGLRVVSLGFLVLTIAKVFLYDLSRLAGVHRVLSFVGLGASLIFVSLLYQRFVVAPDRRR
jgi:uncharacterized membrane protein